jgi:hypothetical protein
METYWMDLKSNSNADNSKTKTIGPNPLLPTSKSTELKKKTCNITILGHATWLPENQ